MHDYMVIEYSIYAACMRGPYSAAASVRFCCGSYHGLANFFCFSWGSIDVCRVETMDVA
jgi:hypothetical protein